MEGIERYQFAIAAPRIGGTLSLQIKWGYALYEAGEYALAAGKFDEVNTMTSDPGTKATMNLMSGRALEMIGDVDTAHAKYLESVYSFPEEYESYLGLITLVDAGVAVSEFQRGLVDYYAEALEPAIAAFNRFIADTPTGTAFFYRGLTRSQLGDPWGALEDLQVVIDSYPEDAIWTQAWFEKASVERYQLSDTNAAVATYLSFVDAAPENYSAPAALFEAARISERMNVLEDAASIWFRIPQEYPNSLQAYEGAFLAGITRFRLNLFSQARDAFLLADAMPGMKVRKRPHACGWEKLTLKKVISQRQRKPGSCQLFQTPLDITPSELKIFLRGGSHSNPRDLFRSRSNRILKESELKPGCESDSSFKVLNHSANSILPLLQMID